MAYGVSGCRSYAGIGQNFFDVEFSIFEDYTEEGDPESGLKPEDPRVEGAVWLRLMRRLGNAFFSYLNVLISEFAKKPQDFGAYSDFCTIKKFTYNSMNVPDPLELCSQISSKLSTSLRYRIENQEDLPTMVVDPAPCLEPLDMLDALQTLVNQHLVISNAICILAGPKFSHKQWPGWLEHRGSWLLQKSAERARENPDKPPPTKLIWEVDPWFGTKFTICDLPAKISDYFVGRGSQQIALASSSVKGTGAPAVTDAEEKVDQSRAAPVERNISTTACGDASAYRLKRHSSIFGAECFDQVFSVSQRNKYLPGEKDIATRRMDTLWEYPEPQNGLMENGVQTSVITPSKTVRRVGIDMLPPNAQLYMHRYVSDIEGKIEITARFFLPCLQPTDADMQRMRTKGTLASVGRTWEDSGYLAKVMMGRIFLRCVATRLHAVTNEAAIAGIGYTFALTSPMNEGQMAVELSLQGYSGQNTRDLLKDIFESFLSITEQDLGNISAAVADVRSSLAVQAENSQYDCRAQLTPNLGLVLVPSASPLPSQLRVLEQIEKKDVIKFMGLRRQGWSVAEMFQEGTIMCVIGGNTTVEEAVKEWMTFCFLEPLKAKKVTLSQKASIMPSTQQPNALTRATVVENGVERLPFHVAVLDLDRVTGLLGDIRDRNNEYLVCPGKTLNKLAGPVPDGWQMPSDYVGPEFVYLWMNNETNNAVQISIPYETDDLSSGMIMVMLKAVEQEYFSWIRDVNNLAYYLSVSVKQVGLDCSLLTFAVCSNTASLQQLLTHSLEIVDAPRGDKKTKARDSKVMESLSGIWTDAKAYEDLRDSIVHMLKEDATVEGLDNRHTMIISDLFSGTHDFDSCVRVADALTKVGHAEFLAYARHILKRKARLVQLAVNAKEAPGFGLSDFQYNKGVGASHFKLAEGLRSLLEEAAGIDGRQWVQLRDPRSLHRLLDNVADPRRPRGYRKGTVLIERQTH